MVLLTMIFLLSSYVALAPTQILDNSLEDKKSVTKQFSQFLEELRKDLKIPGLSAAIVKDEKVLWSEGFGYADLENKIKATPETSYYLASLTKTFASTIVFQLVEQGKLDLDAPISAFGIRANSPGVITVRHLLSHTSEGQPGTFYSYNGYRFSFLGQVIQRASGRSFRELVVENILKPLHMTGTAPNATGKSDDDIPFAQVYERRTQPYGLDANGNVVKGRYETGFLASGGLISTVLDMAKYDIAISQNKFLRPETQEMAFTPFVSADGRRFPYGLGWFTQEYNGVRLIWHYGYYPPSESTLILKVPDEKMTLIVLANMDSLSRPFPLGGGDVLTSPVAVVFFRMFIYPRKTGRELAPVNWKSSPEVIISQLEQEEEEQTVELYKKELMAYWRVYNSMGQGERATGLMNAYSDLFSKATPAAYPGQSVIAEINNVGDNVYQVVEFTLERDVPVRIYGIGEGTNTGMYDFGGIENTETGKLIWLMDYKGTVYAGGDPTNRLANRVTSLPQGTYRLHFKTDKNHSFEHWMSFPPDHAFWGISLYEEKSTGTGDMTASRRPAVIIPPEEITPSQRLLDSAITGQRQEPVVDPILKLILTICGVIFLFAIIIWPVGVLVRFLKSRKSKAVTISKKKSRLSAVGTFMAWVNGVLGLFYVFVAIAKGVLKFLLTNGFIDTQADVKLIFMVIPLVSACILVLLAGFTFLEWKKRQRSPIGRWFFTLYTAASIVFVLLCARYYLMLYT
ncbi:MAG: serine hydrolase [Candidatus Aminicenantes bacterium]|nr:serine hydrolase [Candidatus Aminicenantes bacterium]